MSARRLIGVVALMLLLGVVAGALAFSDGSPRPIGDQTFLAQANGVCEQAAAQRPEPAPPEATLAQRADVVEQSVAVLASMVDDLEQLEVAAQDRAAVQTWLTDWREMIAAGRRFADAIRAQSPDVEDIGNEADAPGMRVEAFAQRNGLDACVF